MTRRLDITTDLEYQNLEDAYEVVVNKLAALQLRTDRMSDVVVRFYVEGVLSEGQAVEVTGLSRVEVRRRAALEEQENG